MTDRRRWGSAVLAVTMMLVLAACGSSGGGDGAASGGATAPAGSTAEPTDAPEATPGGGGGGGGGGGVSGLGPISDGAYSTGTAHVEFSGGRTAAADMEGGGFGTSGFLILTFADQATTASLQLSFGTEEETGMAASIETIATAAGWGTGCSATITRHDASEIAGEFSCDGIDAVDVGEAMKIDVRGTFSAKA